MPQYLARFSYSSESIRAMVDNPQDRAEAARQAIESLGGKLLGFWFAFGDCDGVFIAEAPDNTSAAAISMAVGGTGALSAPRRSGPAPGSAPGGRRRRGGSRRG